ncbi:hypothetical protein BB559_002364 [Furculomyces boomerangus]|uniref:Nitrogen permease regulator 2 n=2 Tax=Harpellales TaxID=61421 RepID=A0A2T9YVZ6_9FUNG|nr:hypothetical protein BB559_002364 [Furculomyces boomerangus]PVZ99160.1 hypothetical protein BB558_004842 [Smittium angustum]PWA00480.1 hypothetical protein BB558_003475 [Smittium angustum]
MIRKIPQIYAIFLVKFHPVQGPEIDFVIPKEKTLEFTSTSSSTKKTTERDKQEQIYTERSSNQFLLPSIEQPVSIDQNPILLSKTKSNLKKEKPYYYENTQDEDIKTIDFNAISSILMPKQILYEKVIKVASKSCVVLGYPVGVSGSYERNYFIFNVCFVFKDSVDSSLYNVVVKRFGQLMKGLEIKMGFLRNRIFKSSLKLLIEKLMQDLNMFGESQILIKLPAAPTLQEHSSVEFNIKLFPSFEKIIEINSYDVPILIVDANDIIQEGEDRDMGMERVVRHINNINHVRRISQLTDMNENRVILILQHLQYYGCIKFTEIFQFCNSYLATSELNKLLESDEMQENCIKFVTAKNTKSYNMPSIIFIFRLYGMLKGDKPISDWMISEDVNWNQIDIRKFIMFGVLNGLIRQIRTYPVLLDYKKATELGWNMEMLSLLDGTRHLDEVAFVLGTETISLRSTLEKYPELIALISR